MPEIVEEKQADQFGQEAEKLVAQSKQFKITNEAQYMAACDFGRKLAASIQMYEGHFGPIKAAAHATWRKLCDKEKALIGPLKVARDELRSKVAVYQSQQRELQKKREEEERLAAIRRQEDQRLAEAETLTAQGRVEEADHVLSAPIVAPAVASMPAVPKVDGVTAARQTWKATVFDLEKLVKAVADGKVPIAALLPNDTFLNQQARALKELMNYPGVRAEMEEKVAFKAGK